MDYAKIWWQNITRARSFIQQLAQHAAEQKAVCFCLPASTCPWPEEFYTRLGYVLSKSSGLQTNEFYHCPPAEALDADLLDKFVPSRRAIDYRGNSTSLGAFIGRYPEMVLHTRRLIVTGIDSPSKLKYWLDFIDAYFKAVDPARPTASFLLQLEEDQYLQLKRFNCSLPALSYGDYANHYSILAYTSMLLADLDLEEKLKTYLSELIALICKDDAELCQLCILNWEELLQGPEDFLLNKLPSYKRSNGHSFTCPMAAEALTTAIWEAQLKAIFPLIEHYRLHFIRTYRSTLEAIPALFNKDGGVDAMEINELHYFARTRKVNLDDDSFQILSCFYTSRNHLAHLKPISYQDILTICK